MKCTACNTEIPESARFCPQCGQAVTPASPASEQSAYGAYGQSGATQPMPSQPSYAANSQPPRYAAQGAPEPPAHYRGYAAGTGYGNVGADNGAPGNGASAYAPAYQAAPAKKSKLPIIIVAIVIVAILAIGAGVCFALGVGPFAGRTGGNIGANGNGTVLAGSNGNALAQLDAVVKDIEASGNFDGTYKLDLDMNLGSLGETLGMESISYAMDGSYSIENYDPNDLSKMKMHLDMDMDVMGEKMPMSIDFADGQAAVTMNGETTTVPYEASDVLAQAGGLAYDADSLKGYVKDARIEDDAIVIDLDDSFLNSILAKSLASSGLADLDASFEGLELRAKVGDGTVDESIDMTFTMTYADYEIKTDLDMRATMTKKQAA